MACGDARPSPAREPRKKSRHLRGLARGRPMSALQLVADVDEPVGQFAAKGLGSGDHDGRDQAADEAIFKSCRAGVVVDEAGENGLHGRDPPRFVGLLGTRGENPEEIPSLPGPHFRYR
jgi:hypothetical protein